MYHIVICDDDTLFIDHMKCLLLRAGLPSETCKFYSYLSASEFEADFQNFRGDCGITNSIKRVGSLNATISCISKNLFTICCNS